MTSIHFCNEIVIITFKNCHIHIWTQKFRLFIYVNNLLKLTKNQFLNTNKMNSSKWENLTKIKLINKFLKNLMDIPLDQYELERLRNFTIQEIVTLPSHIKRSYKFFSSFKILVLSSHIKAYLRSFSFISNELSFMLSNVSI